MSQSKQVFAVFTANVDERAPRDVQHPSPCKEGNTKVGCRRQEVSPPRGLRRVAGGPGSHAACEQIFAPTSEKSGLELPSHILQVVGLLGILSGFALKP